MISQPCMDVQEGCLPFRGVICCTGGIYAAQGGYMLFRRVIWMFRGVIYCSRGLYAVQDGYMLFRRDICCSGRLYYDEKHNDDFSGH